jgi:D-serine deaminase-like pyridoxal phosphate-dependent protein
MSLRHSRETSTDQFSSRENRRITWRQFEWAGGVYTELQCGSYIFMDADYGRNRDRDGAPTKAFEPSLFVWATVMSRPAEDRAIVDAGLKALAFDSGPPLVCDEPAATYERASDEQEGSPSRPPPTASRSATRSA